MQECDDRVSHGQTTMKTRSKAKLIRELYNYGLTTREIAERVRCRPEYVRIAPRQRVSGKIDPAVAYLMRKHHAKKLHSPHEPPPPDTATIQKGRTLHKLVLEALLARG